MNRRSRRHREEPALSEVAAILDVDVRGWPEAVADENGEHTWTTRPKKSPVKTTASTVAPMKRDTATRMG